MKINTHFLLAFLSSASLLSPLHALRGAKQRQSRELEWCSGVPQRAPETWTLLSRQNFESTGYTPKGPWGSWTGDPEGPWGLWSRETGEGKETTLFTGRRQSPDGSKHSIRLKPLSGSASLSTELSYCRIGGYDRLRITFDVHVDFFHGAGELLFQQYDNSSGGWTTRRSWSFGAERNVIQTGLWHEFDTVSSGGTAIRFLLEGNGNDNKLMLDNIELEGYAGPSASTPTTNSPTQEPTSSPTQEPTNSPTQEPPRVGGPSIPTALEPVVDKLDEVRVDAGRERLTWDEDLAALAQNHANGCEAESNPNRNQGQSAYVYERFGTGFASSVPDAVYWATSNFPFTNMVSTETERVGCGFAICPNLNSDYLAQYPSGKSVLVVCNYGASPSVSPPTNSPTQEPPQVGGPSVPAELKPAVDKLDEARVGAGQEPLAWDEDLAALAQNHANGCELESNPTLNQGRSVYVYEHFGTGFAYSVPDAVNWATSNFQSSYMVSPTTERVGCGFAICPDLNPEYLAQYPGLMSVFVVCNYGAFDQ